MIGATINAGGNPFELFEARQTVPAAPAAPTLSAYFARWLAGKAGVVRPAQLRDYRKHIDGYVLPVLGMIPLDALTPRDLVGLQAQLLARPLHEHARQRLPVPRRATTEQ